MTLIKTSLLNAVAVLVRMLTLLGINKILAIYVGPAGYAALGQFQNAVQMITTFASGAINNGVTKYTAEYYADAEQQQLVWRSAGSIALTGSILSAILVVIFQEPLALWFLHDVAFSSVFVWFGVTLPLFVLNLLLLAILNGKKEIRYYVIANIFGSLFSLLLTVIMVIQYGLYGALVVLAIYQSMSFFITFGLIRSLAWFRTDFLFGKVDAKVAVKLAKFTAMTLAGAICIPLSHVVIRNHIGSVFGWNAAGYWEALWRLSSAYLMLITTTLSVYYLPKISELKTPDLIRYELLNGYKIIMPFAAICSACVYFSRDFIVPLLFSPDFYSIRDLLGWQMVGDVVKIAAWMLGHVLVAKAEVKAVVISEIIFSILFYLLVVVFTQEIGLQGVMVSYALNNFLYLLFLVAYVRFKKIVFDFGFIK